jgi:hypothetical protein
LDLNEIKIILDDNKNITTLADAAKALLNTKKQKIDRKAIEKFHVLKKRWQDFDKLYFTYLVLLIINGK